MNAKTLRGVYFVMAMGLLAGVCQADPDNEPVASAASANPPAVQDSSNNSTPPPVAAPVSTPAPKAKKLPGLIVKITAVSGARNVAQLQQEIADAQALSSEIRDNNIPESDVSRIWTYWQSRGNAGSPERADQATRIHAQQAYVENLDIQIRGWQHQIENAAIQRSVTGVTDDGYPVLITAENFSAAAQADAIVLGGTYQIFGEKSLRNDTYFVNLTVANRIDVPAAQAVPQSAPPEPQANNLEPAAMEGIPNGQGAPAVLGREIDLLAQVRLPEDRVRGGWKPNNGTMTGHGFLRLKAPPAGEYDFHIVFAKQSGERWVTLFLTYKGSSFGWITGLRNKFSGFSATINNSPKPKLLARSDGVLEVNTNYDVVIKVRKDSISAWVNGKLSSEYSANYAEMGLPDDLSPMAGSLGIASPDPIVIDSADVTPVSNEEPQPAAGPGADAQMPESPAANNSAWRSAAPVSAVAENNDTISPPDDGPVEVQPAAFTGDMGLGQVQLADDVVQGNWTSTAQGIQSDDTPASRLYLPYLPSGQYDYHMTFTRVSGDGPVSQVLSYGGHSFTWVMWNDGYGFGLIRGRVASQNRSTVQMAGAIVNGRQYQTMVQVRRNYVAAYVDGRLVDHINTNYSDFNLNPRVDLGGTALGVSSDSPVLVSSVRVASVDNGYWMGVGGHLGWPHWRGGRWWYDHRWLHGRLGEDLARRRLEIWPRIPVTPVQSANPGRRGAQPDQSGAVSGSTKGDVGSIGPGQRTIARAPRVRPVR
jgi:hypothetical protein